MKNIWRRASQSLFSKTTEEHSVVENKFSNIDSFLCMYI